MTAEVFTSPQDSYTVVREYARGGMGVTYLVKSSKSGESLILKHLRMDRMEDWKVLELFEREAEVLKRLHHQRIPKYIDYFADDARGHFNLVQSFVEGETMQQWIDRQAPVTPDDFLRYFRQCLEILDYLHSMVPPVVHRDITPKNIILNKGEAYLVDFGSVKSAIRPEAALTTSVGTFGYMPPEQTMGRAEPGSDLYSLAMSFIALASHLDPTSLPLDKQTGQVDVHQVLTHLPGPITSILESMTRMGLDERIRSAHEVLDQLDQPGIDSVVASTRIKPVAAGSARPRFHVVLPSKRSSGAWILALFAFLILAGGIIWSSLLPEKGGSGEPSSDASTSANAPPPPSSNPLTHREVPTESVRMAVGLSTDDVITAVTSHQWRGTIGSHKGSLMFAKKESRWTGVLSLEDGSRLKMSLDVASGVVVLKGDRINDNVKMSSTLYGRLTEDLSTLVGTIEIVYEQGGTSYSSEEAWQMTHH